MTLARVWLSLTLLALVTGPTPAQTAPAAAQASLGSRIQLGGQIMLQDLSGAGLTAWSNSAGHRVTVRVTDASGEPRTVARGLAVGGRLAVEVGAPEPEVLLPVADYAGEISAMFSESFFGPIAMTASVSDPTARVQRFARLEVHTAEDLSAGFVQRWREERSSTMQLSWLYADRDVTLFGHASAPGVSGEVDLRLKRGWNSVLMTLIYERGRDGQFLLRSSTEPGSMQWVYWQIGG
ncbi:MAG: hypothetical protein EA384_15790 [Spirochaetaceae bacterium]|nr:MAG: hypothetical protein EA384_15790 [Spirochaetaceae bacterium]